MQRLLPATVVFVVAICALLPTMLDYPQFMDENFYVWSGAYYGGKIVHLDFNPQSGATPDDPAWDPENWWSVCAPMPFRLVYAGAMGITGSIPPTKPYKYTDPVPTIEGQPDALIPDKTLQVVRLTAVLCSALGIAALEFRFGWFGVLGLLLIFMPDGARNLSRAMAEPVLVLTLGFSVITYGSRWFPVAAAFAGGSKLTAFLMWPLLLQPKANGRFGWFGLPLAFLFWTIGNPSSWFAGGPLYLLSMLARRQVEYSAASTVRFHLPTWYLIPVEYGLICLMIFLLPRTRLGQCLILAPRSFFHPNSANPIHPATHKGHCPRKVNSPTSECLQPHTDAWDSQPD
jgi:hypothetical protein